MSKENCITYQRLRDFAKNREDTELLEKIDFYWCADAKCPECHRDDRMEQVDERTMRIKVR